jgi:hypothetical protein
MSNDGRPRRSVGLWFPYVTAPSLVRHLCPTLLNAAQRCSMSRFPEKLVEKREAALRGPARYFGRILGFNRKVGSARSKARALEPEIAAATAAVAANTTTVNTTDDGDVATPEIAATPLRGWGEKASEEAPKATRILL